MQRIALALLAHIEESTVGVDLEGECLLFTADMSSESCSQFDSLPRIYLFDNDTKGGRAQSRRRTSSARRRAH